jgi:hypothetical protein
VRFRGLTAVLRFTLWGGCLVWDELGNAQVKLVHASLNLKLAWDRLGMTGEGLMPPHGSTVETASVSQQFDALPLFARRREDITSHVAIGRHRRLQNDAAIIQTAAGFQSSGHQEEHAQISSDKLPAPGFTEQGRDLLERAGPVGQHAQISNHTQAADDSQMKTVPRSNGEHGVTSELLPSQRNDGALGRSITGRINVGKRRLRAFDRGLIFVCR